MDAVYTHHLEPTDKARCEALEVSVHLAPAPRAPPHACTCHLPASCAVPAASRSLQVFDELEEWRMIQQHYSICLGIHEGAQHQGRLAGSVGFGEQGVASASPGGHA